MPIYEYECQACKHYLDVLQKLSDDPLTYCPECGKAELRKLVSAPSFRLKGGGWYETDFKKDNQRNLADGGGADKSGGKTDKTDGKSTAAGDGKGESKGDSKSGGKDASKTAVSKPAASSSASKGSSGGGDSA